MTAKLHAHQLLEGMVLQNEWRVLKRLDRAESATGSCFSCGYITENAAGARGYLKALDFFSRLSEPIDPSVDMPRFLEPLLKAFNFERDLLNRCKDRRLSRIVMALDDGAVTIPGIPPPATVYYIIFELADGDVRGQMARVDKLDIVWALRVLHQMATGLEQLHTMNVAHQDVKPSNVLVFADPMSSKLGDLGRAAEKGIEPPHYESPVPGDPSYAPPELLYGAVPDSWDAKRMGCDAYLLGSMIASLFTTVAMTPLIMMKLDDRFHWTKWHGSYEEALPYVRAAFVDAVSYVADEFPLELRSELTEALEQLCDPDPALRGHPVNRQMRFGNRYSLERYISQFNTLASRYEVRVLRP